MKALVFAIGATVAVVGLIKLYDVVGHKAMYWISVKSDELTLRRAYEQWGAEIDQNPLQ